VCIDSHQTGFVGKGSDHLQLIKFCPSGAPSKGVCGGVKIFGSALLQPARGVFFSSERFFHYGCHHEYICHPFAAAKRSTVQHSAMVYHGYPENESVKQV